jgi:hypothetical protein
VHALCDAIDFALLFQTLSMPDDKRREGRRIESEAECVRRRRGVCIINSGNFNHSPQPKSDLSLRVQRAAGSSSLPFLEISFLFLFLIC